MVYNNSPVVLLSTVQSPLNFMNSSILTVQVSSNTWRETINIIDQYQCRKERLQRNVKKEPFEKTAFEELKQTTDV